MVRSEHPGGACRGELQGILVRVQAGLLVRELRGIVPARSPLEAAWGYLRRRELGGFRLSDDLRFVFAGYACRLEVVPASSQ